MPLHCATAKKKPSFTETVARRGFSDTHFSLAIILPHAAPLVKNRFSALDKPERLCYNTLVADKELSRTTESGVSCGRAVLFCPAKLGLDKRIGLC